MSAPDLLPAIARGMIVLLNKYRECPDAAQIAMQLALALNPQPLPDRLPPKDVPSRQSLARRRKRLGFSQRALARDCRISRGLLSDLEGGRRASPYTLIHVGQVLSRLEGRDG